MFSNDRVKCCREQMVKPQESVLWTILKEIIMEAYFGKSVVGISGNRDELVAFGCDLVVRQRGERPTNLF